MNRRTLTRKRVLVPAVAVLALTGGGVAWAATASADTVTGADRDRVAEAAAAAVPGGTVTDVETSDDPGVAYEVDLRAADGTEIDLELAEDLSVVSRHTDDHDGDRGDRDGDRGDRDDDRGDRDDDRDVTADQRRQAEAAALAEVADGVVTDVEADDDRGAAYEVDLVQPDGTRVDLRLDDTFAVVSRQDEPRRDERGLSADQVQRAEQAALAEVADGIVTDVESSDDQGVAYEVDVVTADGQDVDVELDSGFAVVSVDR